MWVIKIGGSLARTPALACWLALIAADHGRRWLIVPGGGPYADAVREMQECWGFDDASAHRMAVQAMGLYGAQLAAMAPALEAGTTLRELARARRSGIWCPDAAAARDFQGLPEDWRSSADSIALWAAQTLQASGLVLLKSAPPPPAAGHDAGTLARCGYLDVHFPLQLRAQALPCFWLSGAEPPAQMPAARELEAQRIHPR